VGRAHDDDGIDGRIGEQVVGIAVGARHVELGRDLGGEGGVEIGHRGDARFGDAPREVAGVDPAETTESDEATLRRLRADVAVMGSRSPW